MDDLQNELGPEKLIYVDYHLRQPLKTPDTEERSAYYTVHGTPTVFFNGGDRAIGRIPPPYERYKEIIERHLADSASISVSVSTGPGEVPESVALTIDLEVALGETIEDPQDCTVRAFVYEDNVDTLYGTFIRIARTMVVEQPLTVGESGQTASITETFELDSTWKPEDLSVVAWVQRESTMEILNSTSFKIADPTPVATTSWGAAKASFR